MLWSDRGQLLLFFFRHNRRLAVIHPHSDDIACRAEHVGLFKLAEPVDKVIVCDLIKVGTLCLERHDKCDLFDGIDIKFICGHGLERHKQILVEDLLISYRGRGIAAESQGIAADLDSAGHSSAVGT